MSFRVLRQPLCGEWKSVVLAVLVANAVFLSLALLTTQVSQESLKRRIVQAFAAGSLPLNTDVEFRTWMFGNECLILQMLLNQDDDKLRQALGPKVYFREDNQRQCHLVREIALHGKATEAQDSFHYTRYWHGHNAAAAALLTLMDFSTIRIVLRTIGYGSLALLAIAGFLASWRLRIVAITVAVVGAAFWGLQDFAHSLGNGPADTVLILGLAYLLFRFGHSRSAKGFATHCAAFGAVVTYMEFFMGQLPTAAALLLPIGYMIHGEVGSSSEQRQDWHFASSGVLAFVLGAAMTIAVKQVLAYALFGAPALASFFANLDTYTQNLATIGIQGSDNHLKSAIYAMGGMIWKWGKVLTYGSDLGARLLFLCSALAWLGAAILAWRARSAPRPGAFQACAAGSAIVAAWIAVLPSHSLGHGWFMIRMMVAPIALGWAALIIEMRRLRLQATQHADLTTPKSAAVS